MRVPASVLVVFSSFLLLSTILVLDAGRPPGATAPRATVDVPALIDQLAAVDHGDIGYSSIVSGSYFAPLEREGQPGIALLASSERLAPSETLRQIVRQGAAAIPHLLDHLDDRRKTPLEIGRGDWQPLGLFFCRTPDYNAWTTPPPRAEDDRDVMVHLRRGTAERETPTHTVTVGDLCFVALGQIVNRDYCAVRYRPTGFVLVSSPTHSASLCAAVRREWEGCTPQRHRASLVNDFLWADHDGRLIGACRRLGYYYPRTLEALVVPLLAATSPLGPQGKTALIEEALAHDSSARIDRAVRDLLVNHPDDDRLAVACMKRLIGRGFDADIERYCRRRIPVAGEWKESLQEMLAKVGWTRGHVAIEQADPDALCEWLRRRADVNAAGRDGRTPLHLAAAKGDIELVRLLLSAWPLLDIKDARGKTPVQRAAWADHDAVVRLLVERGCDVPDLLVAAAAGTADHARAILRADPDAVNVMNEHGRTPLYLAARRGDAAMAALLLENGAAPETADEEGCTPLHLAAYHGDVVLTRLLLEHKAPVDAALEDTGYTPVDIAVLENKKEVLRLLLAAGAAVNRKDHHNATALHRAVQKGDAATVRLLLEHGADVSAWCDDDNPDSDRRYQPVHLAAKHGSKELLELLLAHGADLSSKCPHSDDTPLHLAAAAGRVETARLLLARGASVDARDRYGATPLYRAAEGGHVELARLLLEHHADVRGGRMNGDEPLNGAVRAHRVEAARLLLDHGADPNARPEPLLHVAVCAQDAGIIRLLLSRGAAVNAPNSSGETALDFAILLRDASIVRLLLRHGSAVRRDELDGSIQLYTAVHANDLEVARLLLEHGADMQAKDPRVGWQPLHVAAQHEDGAAMVALLLDHKADINARQKYDGRTALHLALIAEEVATVRLLLERGASWSIEDDSGQTALDLAREQDDPDVLTLFRRYGARR